MVRDKKRAMPMTAPRSRSRQQPKQLDAGMFQAEISSFALRPPLVADKLVPVFTPEELTRLEQACAGRSFTQRRDTAIIAVFTATGIRLSELADLRYDPSDPRDSDIDLWQREITVRGKGGRPRIVKIGHRAARSVDRYLRARSRHAYAWRPQLWL